MIKKYSLVVAVFLCFVLNGFGQVTIYNENMYNGTGGTSGNSIAIHETNNRFNEDGLTYSGTGDMRTTNPSSGYTGASGLWNVLLNANTETLIMDGLNVSAYTSITLSFGVKKSTLAETGSNLVVEYSTTGITGPYNAVTILPLLTGTGSTTSWYYRTSTSIIPTNITTIRFRSTSTEQWNIDDIVFSGLCPAAVDYANIQFPTASPQTITDGDNFEVYAQAYEPGVTEAAGAGPGLVAWIGYNTVNNNPNSVGWTWIPAPFNVQVGNNDEFFVEIGSGLAPGTYYYASRFQLNGCQFVYGGTGGVWNNDSVQLIVEADQVNFCNVDFPKTATIITGNSHTVYAQVFEPGVTDNVGQGANILAWIGYNSIDVNYEPWQATGWTWVPATYGSDESNDMGNPIANDQYVATFGATLPSGTYYYASRFELNGSTYSYGGIQADNVGNFWSNGTTNSGILTITDPPLADVVITEIMYNTPTTGGADDDWMEICNASGSIQNLSGYIVRVNSTTRFTFPIGSFINDGECLTIDLGNGGGAEYNFDCPFIPDFSSGLGTGTLPNTLGPNSIQLFAANGTTLADSVTYGSGNGGNGNGASLHLSDIALDNSSAGLNWQQVLYGGTPGINFLVSSCAPIVPEIDVERNTFASITSSLAAANTGNNTLWTTVNVGDSSNKTYYVRNEGLANLTINSMASNNADFTLVNIPSFPFVLVPGAFFEFEIEFSPTSATPATRDGIITIVSNDADENPYTFRVRGTAGCPLYTGTMFPTSGPVGTEITITSAQNLTGATATLDGVALTVVSATAGALVVKIPNTVTTGGALTVTLSGGCSFTNSFTLIDKVVAGCEGSVGTIPNNIFISQVTDSGDDSLTFIELYNGTGGTININNYSLRLYNNGRPTPVSSSYIIDLNNVNLLNGDTYVVAIGTNDMDCATQHNLSARADQQYNIVGVSLNFSNNGNNTEGHDHLRLYSNTTHIDSWGIYQNESWATSLNLDGKGANFMRRTDVTVPNTTYTNADWEIQDWGNTCADLDYSDIGAYDFSVGTPPTVSILNPPVASCDLSTSLTVTGAEGVGGGNGLAYQWYYSAPGDLGWTVVPDNAIYDDVDTETLLILNTSTLNNYQYYCEVREDDATCYVASNAIKLEVSASIWNGTAWIPSVPDINTIAIIDGDYDMSVTGANEPSFSACQLVVNTGALLTIEDNKFVEVENNVTVNGSINLKSKGSFVQNNNAGLVDGAVLTTRNKIVVEKMTALIDNWYEYTYWSSPVAGETVGTALAESTASRRFWYNGANFLDSFAETGNNNAAIAGQDDIDDNDNDWTLAPAALVMQAGVGYASTLSTSGFTGPNRSYQFTFEGPFNNGIVTVPIYRNDSELADNNWNFIGNPYPSAISANSFLAANTFFDLNGPGGPMAGAIFLWSQDTSPSDGTNGNEAQNFAQSDFAIINGAGELPGGDGITPTRFIPSGQGFFVAMANAAPATVVSGQINTADVTFNNSMRVTANNNQFFRVSQNGTSENKLRVDLTSNNGVFSPLLVAYVNGATDGNDGMYYDASKNLSTNANAIIYTLINGNTDLKLGIQGKNPASLSLDEVIPMGFYTSITQPTTYRLSIADIEGSFLTSNTVYLRDNLMDITFNLTLGDYIFSSEKGEFNTRFEIVFRAETLSVIDNEIPANGLTIIELPTGEVKFTVTNSLNITSVELFDMLGRRIYQFKGDSPSEVYDISNLSQAAYMAKVTLSNGQVITKRAVKRY